MLDKHQTALISKLKTDSVINFPKKKIIFSTHLKIVHVHQTVLHELDDQIKLNIEVKCDMQYCQHSKMSLFSSQEPTK